MRLTSQEHHAIRHAILSLDPHAEIYLYGSRADDTKRGGDIDLLVLSQVITERERTPLKLKLYDTLGEQKIDLLIAQDSSQPFIQIALSQGVRL